jgi:hypothetical protein
MKAKLINDKADGKDLTAKFQSYKVSLSKDADNTYYQRGYAADDMSFVNDKGGQWDENDIIGTADANGNYPDRMRLEFDIVTDFKNKFVGRQINQSVSVEYKPKDEATNDDDAELMNGIFRSAFDENSGVESVTQALDEFATCGNGSVQLRTQFVDDEDGMTENQEIVFDPVINSYNTIIWDSGSMRSDKRDAMHCTVLRMYTMDSFEAEYPGHTPSSVFDPKELTQRRFKLTGEDIFFIGERYQIVQRMEFVHRYFNRSTGLMERFKGRDFRKREKEIRRNPDLKFVGKRKVKTQWVEKSILSGTEFLQDPERIVGKFIPIIPYFAYWAHTDEMGEVFYGLIRKVRDRQTLMNTLASKIAEDAHTASAQIPITPKGALEDPVYRESWADRSNQGFLEFDLVYDKQNNLVNPQGVVGWTPPPQADQNAVQLIELITAQMRDISGAPPQEILDSELSGKAIGKLTKKLDENTLVLVQHIAKSTEWMGVVFASMAQEIFSSQQSVQVRSKDGTDGRKQIMEQKMNEETGELEEVNRLDNKKFKVRSDTGPSYESEREQAVEDGLSTVGVVTQIQTPEAQALGLDILKEVITLSPSLGLGTVKDKIRKEGLANGTIKPETEEDEAFLEQVRQSQQAQANQPNPEQDALSAIANEKNANAKKLEADTVKSIEEAKNKAANTEKTLSEVGVEREKANLTAREKARDTFFKGFKKAS